MSRYAIAVDIDRCVGCFSCFIACRDEYVGNDHLPISAAQPVDAPQKWVEPKEFEYGAGDKVKVDYIPIMCQHCADAPCMLPGPPGAVYRRDDGIVIIDPEKAKGHKEIASACPYGTITWNAAISTPQKCTMCAHLLDKGETNVRCAEVCPSQAMMFGDLDDPESQISKYLAGNAERVEDYKPEFGTQPVVKYLSLPKPFIAGEILLSDKQEECVKGAKVSLITPDGKVEREAETDFLGDFELKGLPKDIDYTLKAEYEGYYPVEMTVRSNAAKNVGVITLQAK